MAKAPWRVPTPRAWKTSRQHANEAVLPVKYGRAKTFVFSWLQDMTSQISLHSSNYESFSLSDLTEPDSVSRCKQEEFTCGLSKRSFKGSRGANQTKNALGLQQTREQSTVEVQAEEALLM